MPPAQHRAALDFDRRRALRLGIVRGVLWAIGTGLTAGDILRYLAQDLGAGGLGLGLILAIPSLAGLLRLAAPAVMRWFGSAKRTCLAAHAASYVLLATLPIVWVQESPTSVRVWSLIGIAGAAHLLDDVGWVAYWTWWGDIVPLPIRGRYYGRLQIWQIAATLPTLYLNGRFLDWWSKQHVTPTENLAASHSRFLGYSLVIVGGALCLLISLVPLAKVKAMTTLPPPRLVGWRAIAEPLRNRRFRTLLAFRGWFGLANGITQTAQAIFPKAILHFGLGDLAIMTNTMRCGQAVYSSWVGRFSDRYGNRPVLVFSQFCVALSMLFFLAAAPAPPGSRWLLLAAYVLWSAYAGHNVCLPNLALKMADDQQRAPFVAAHEAIGSLAHATATVFGGWLWDRLDGSQLSVFGFQGISAAACIFLIGFALRLAAVGLAAQIREPGSWAWLDIVRGHKAFLAGIARDR
jgi:MFS family permease